MRDFIKLLLICCFCVFISSTAAHAQWQTDPTDPAAGSKPYSSEEKTLKLPDMSNVDMAAGIAAQQKAQAAIEKAAVDAMQREVDEAVYYQRGLTMDFLNKPIELFKLTCTAKSKVDRDTGKKEVQLSPSFKFNKDMWKDFCKDTAKKVASGSKITGGQAVKCAFEQVLQNVFSKAVDQIEKFKDQGFCKAFTSFVNDQLSQCINIRVNMPRGQFPGFPAFNQCLFGRLNLEVGVDGVRAGGSTGPALADVVSVHSFNYDKNIKDFTPFGFGGKEQQLLGENGVSALMDNANWENVTIPGVAGAACGQLDPELTKILDDYPSRDMGAGMNVLLFANPHIKATKLAEGDGKGTRIVADYKQVFNPTLGSEESILIPPTPEAGGGPDPLSWSVKSGYTYLASCYGFEREDPAMACKELKAYSPDAYDANCVVEKDPEGCCNPDTTDCLGAGIVYPTDACVDGLTTKDAKGNTVCVQLAHAAGDAMICPSACCNPDLNNCGLINAQVCEKYIPVKQCLTATPAQQAMFDPVYSKLRAKPNMMIDGRMCCSTEWCNLCPQDLFGVAENLPKGVGIYMKNSEIANIPENCKTKPRTNGGNPMNDIAQGNMLIPVADAVFDNTQEACTLINEGDGEKVWDFGRVFKIFIDCPQRQASTSKIPIIGGTIATIAGAVEGCPSGGEIKPFRIEVIRFNMCNYMADINRYPMPITKIPKVEEGDPIGLCSELDLCPAAIPAGENPYGTLKSVVCKTLEKLGRPCLTAGGPTTPTGPADGGAVCRDATGAQVRCAGVEGETIVPNTGNDGTKIPVEPIVIPDVPNPTPTEPAVNLPATTTPEPATNEPAGKLY